MIRKNCEFGKLGRKMGKERKERCIFAWGLLFSGAFAALQLAARNIAGFGEWYAVTVYPVLEGSIGRFFGLFPFSVVEIFLYAMVAGTFLYGFFHLGQWKMILSRTFLLISVLLFLYTVNCGINYYRRPFSGYLNYSIRTYKTEELAELLEELTRQVNLSQEERKGGGVQAVGNTDMASAGVKAMRGLGEGFPALGGFYPRPKEILFSEILSVQQLAGIYSPFTIEANYNGDMSPYNIPHTICHELSHLKGFMREDEANFIGFLACIGSEDEKFRYSGYLAGWIHAGNALAAEDPVSYAEFWNLLNDDTKQELRENTEFWDRYDTKVAEVSEALNDTYLKANSQPEGVKSYGRVVDLLLAWFHQ